MSRHHSSLAAPPLDDEDLFQEILLRLPPKPSSFPRASLVCKRWRSILSDPRFLLRFRKHHRKPLLLGFFDIELGQAPVFTPMLDPPDCIPAASFALPENLLSSKLWTTLDGHLSFSFHGCRHGISLFLDRNSHEAVLWDPLTDVQCRVAFPPGLGIGQVNYIWNAAALLCSAGDEQRVHDDCHLSPFKLVFVCHNLKHTKAFICIYESKSGVWGDIISTATTYVTRYKPSVLIGNTLCWLLGGGDILEFDCERLNLAIIEKPVDAHAAGFDVNCSFQILRGEDNGLGLAVLSVSTMSIQLWARKSNCDGVISWVLRNTVQLDELELFSRHTHLGKLVLMLGYDEDTNVIFLSSDSHDFSLQLESMQFNYIGGREYKSFRIYYPYTNFYPVGALLVEMVELKMGTLDIGYPNYILFAEVQKWLFAVLLFFRFCMMWLLIWSTLN